MVAVGLTALRLGSITTDLTSIETSSDTVASANREALLLEQMVTALDDSRRSRLGLSALVGLVLALGVAGVTIVTRRSRSRIAVAYVEAVCQNLLADADVAAWSGTGGTSPTGGRWRTSSRARPTTTR